jgi:hypothetical protein
LTGATPLGLSLTWPSKTLITWENTIATVDVVRGNLGTLRSTGNWTTSVFSCPYNDRTNKSAGIGFTPAPGESWYILVRPEVTYCNEDAGSYSSKAASEQGSTPFAGSDRDVGINASGSSCTATP